VSKPVDKTSRAKKSPPTKKDSSDEAKPVWERLFESRSKADTAMKRARQEQEEREMKDCTFAPRVTKPSRKHSRFATQMTSERLHAEAALRQHQKEVRAKAAEQEEMERFPYHPMTNAGRSQSDALAETIFDDSADPRPLYERAEDVRREHEEHLRRKRIESITADSELTFQPRISRASDAMVRKRRGTPGVPDEAVEDRLMREARDKEERRNERRRRLADEEAVVATFEPATNDLSSKLIADNPKLSVGFLERQREFLKTKQRKIDTIAKATESADCTFHPKSSTSKELLAYTRPELGLESTRQRYERLSKKDAEKAQKLKDAISEEYYSRFHFKPKINPISRELGRARTVDEHVHDERRKKAVERLKEEAEREEQEQCTFRPELHSDPDKVLRQAEIRRGGNAPFRLAVGADPDGVGDRVQEHMQRRQAKLDRERRAQEYRELQDCTFVPRMVAEPPRPPTGPVVVRGIAKHMENRDRAEKLREEAKRREEEAFQVRGIEGRVPGEPTIPEPFRLATANNPRRMARVARERATAEAEAMKECRFRPETGAALVDDAIKAMLDADDDIE
jgi:hypothetical protein